jgi:DNA polymerase-3 subunit delta
MSKASAKTTGPLSAYELIANPDAYPLAGACAIFGDEEYLKREVLVAVRRKVSGGDDSELAITYLRGKEAQLRDVLDALNTRSLFGSGRQMVVLEDADPFVMQFRAELEDLVARPASAGSLVLDVKTWPGNTRLAKAVAVNGIAIECRSYESCKPQERSALTRQIKKWLVERAKLDHSVRLDAAAVSAMMELLPTEPGILAQEVEKLALLVDKKGIIDAQLVRENVGNWRTRTTWDMIDAAAEGRAAEALAQLDRLLIAGEDPHALLPQMATSLRRFATAAALIQAGEASRQRVTFKDALVQAGVPNNPFVVSKAENQLKQIGRQRAKQITEWLLAADLAIKSYNSSNDRARMEIERLIVRLSTASSLGPPSRGAPHPARLAKPAS